MSRREMMVFATRRGVMSGLPMGYTGSRAVGRKSLGCGNDSASWEKRHLYLAGARTVEQWPGCLRADDGKPGGAELENGPSLIWSVVLVNHYGSCRFGGVLVRHHSPWLSTR